jgi:putative ABC transport system permease protein
VRLFAGAEVRRVHLELHARLPADIVILTRQELIERERHYWKVNTPIGYVFTFGVVMGLIVGGVIVYQILFANISDHMKEFATLKAIGCSDGYLNAVVLQQALMLAVLGYVPGVVACVCAYSAVARATYMPLEMTPTTALVVLLLTASMCCLSALIALRKVRAADPAEVFA